MVRITDQSKPLTTISGATSQYESGGRLQKFICEHGGHPVFGPVSDKNHANGYKGMYEFAFKSRYPSDENIKLLADCTIDLFFDSTCHQINGNLVEGEINKP